MSSTKDVRSKSMIDLQLVVWLTFLIAILVLLVSLGTITVMMVIRPPCTTTGTVCVDGWSVAGLAAVILGVGGTMLTVISGLAVAAWWVNLNKRVTAQVKKQVAKTLEDISVEVDFAQRQLEGVLRFIIYTAFPKGMKLEDFNLSDLKVCMGTISVSAPLVNAHIYQAALARFEDALDLTAARNKKLEIENMLHTFSWLQGTFPLDTNKRHPQQEVSELERISKEVTDQFSGIKRKI